MTIHDETVQTALGHQETPMERLERERDEAVSVLTRAVEDAEYTDVYGCCAEGPGTAHHPAHHPNCWVPDAREAIGRADR